MTRKSRHILMLVENHYPQDTRVRNEASLLQSHGYQVTVVALGDPDQGRSETMANGVRVYRIPALEVFTKTGAGAVGFLGRVWLKVKATVGYVAEYSYFTGMAFAVTFVIWLRQGFDAIHAHNPPDTLFVVALPYKLIGKKFVFDHHDLSPELYKSRYRTVDDSLITRVLGVVEALSLRLADATIATNESYRDVHLERGSRRPEQVFIVRNGPNDDRMGPFDPSERLRGLGKCVLAYVGALNPQDGVDYLLRALSHLRYDLGREDFHCVIMGGGDSLEDLRSLSAELGLTDVVEIPGHVSEHDLRANLAAADICLDPDPSSPLNDVSTWIKIMEYMAFSKPIVSFDLKETRYSAQDAALFVPPNDEAAFARAVADLMDDPERRAQMGAFGRARVESELQWSVVGERLLHAYRYLFGEPGVASAEPLGTVEDVSFAPTNEKTPSAR